MHEIPVKTHECLFHSTIFSAGEGLRVGGNRGLTKWEICSELGVVRFR